LIKMNKDDKIDYLIATRVMGWDFLPSYFSPTKNIQDLERVLDEITRNNHRFQTYIKMTFDIVVGWHVSVTINESDPKHGSAEGGNLKRLICVAILRALGFNNHIK